jgi:hypothetical protein
MKAMPTGGIKMHPRPELTQEQPSATDSEQSTGQIKLVPTLLTPKKLLEQATSADSAPQQHPTTPSHKDAPNEALLATPSSPTSSPTFSSTPTRRKSAPKNNTNANATSPPSSPYATLSKPGPKQGEISPRHHSNNDNNDVPLSPMPTPLSTPISSPGTTPVSAKTAPRRRVQEEAQVYPEQSVQFTSLGVDDHEKKNV